MAPPSRLAEPAAWQFIPRPHGRLDVVDAAGNLHLDIDLLRAFPISAPLGPVAVVAPDGSELAWIDTIDNLPEPLRGELLRELSSREFLPVIDRIEAIGDSDPAEWTVLTDRGPRRFLVATPDDVERLADGSALVVDGSGVRYRIAAIAALDSHSRRLLDRTME